MSIYVGSHRITIWHIIIIPLVIFGLYTGLTYNNIHNRYNRLLDSVVTVKSINTEIDIKSILDSIFNKTPIIPKMHSTLSIGSGTFIKKHYILTADHVVHNQTDISILIHDKEYVAQIVNENVFLDVAVLYIPSFAGKPASLADSSKVTPGDEVITVGSPLFLQNTLGQGFITAPVRKPYGLGLDYIQFWSQIFHGNSGGGLFNSNNELLGVVTAVYTGQYEYAQLFDLATPINDVKAFINSSIANFEKSK